MSRYRLDIEYEGTRYRGWQRQINARSVQGMLEEKIRLVTHAKEFDFGGSGRTDAGVHALHQVAHLEIETPLSPEILRRKLNTELPADINILRIAKAAPNFHSRHHAKARSYLYQISRRRTAFGKRFVWWVREELDLDRMTKAIEIFQGMKDFRSFTADSPEEKSTRVLIEEMRIVEAGDLILVRIVGSHFLWKMVRRLIGVVVEVGKGNLSIDDLKRWMIQQEEEAGRYTAPPSGLFLEKVYYEGEPRLESVQPVLNL